MFRLSPAAQVLENSCRTPLCGACSKGHVEMVKMLLDAGADKEPWDIEFWGLGVWGCSIRKP